MRGRKQNTREKVVHWNAKVFPTHLVSYPVHDEIYVRSGFSPLTPRKTQWSEEGYRIKRAINILLLVSRRKKIWSKKEKRGFTFRVNLITLTLPSKQIHCDTTIKRVCLDNWLKYARWKFGLVNYVWKAEKQEEEKSRGNIHFHITTDCFIHHRDIRKSWNNCVQRLGYVTRSGLLNPPTENVHAVRKIKKLAGYLANYLSKEQTQFICGKRWSASHSLSQFCFGIPDFPYSPYITDIKDWKRVTPDESIFSVHVPPYKYFTGKARSQLKDDFMLYVAGRPYSKQPSTILIDSFFTN